MQNQLYPANYIQNSAESYISKHHLKSNIIYKIIFIFFIAALISLPFIKIDISVQSNGIIRPVSEKSEIKSLVSGIVSNIEVSENQKIKEGQIILKINSNLEQQIKSLEIRLNDKNEHVHDIEIIIKMKNNLQLRKLKTSLYKEKHFQYSSEIKSIINKIKKAKMEFNRSEALFKNKLISKADYEEKLYQYKSYLSEKELIQERYLSELQSDLITNKFELQKLKLSLQDLQNKISLYEIKSPVTGTIEEFSGISIGTYIQAGQMISIISPDTSLIAEMYITPKDIGFIKENAKTDIQVDAFNYNDWGFIPAHITSISEDFMIINQSPFFRVKCFLSKDHLSLTSGVKGYLKKGMTVRGRFFITKRSLFQLLYDDINDWINPKNNPNISLAKH